ncbi:MAG: hypothetical protein FH761_16670 [Firmicutes bacterium]|nr:hypothetical protein [Bacillota bacterium]
MLNYNKLPITVKVKLLKRFEGEHKQSKEKLKDVITAVPELDEHNKQKKVTKIKEYIRSLEIKIKEITK